VALNTITLTPVKCHVDLSNLYIVVIKKGDFRITHTALKTDLNYQFVIFN